MVAGVYLGGCTGGYGGGWAVQGVQGREGRLRRVYYVLKDVIKARVQAAR